MSIDKRKCFVKDVSLTSWPKVLKIIGDELWSCEEHGITVYDRDLKQLRCLPKLKRVWSVAELDKGMILTAGFNGLERMTPQGKDRVILPTDSAWDMCLSSKLCFVTLTRAPVIKVYLRSDLAQHVKRPLKKMRAVESDEPAYPFPFNIIGRFMDVSMMFPPTPKTNPGKREKRSQPEPNTVKVIKGHGHGNARSPEMRFREIKVDVENNHENDKMNRDTREQNAIRRSVTKKESLNETEENEKDETGHGSKQEGDQFQINIEKEEQPEYEQGEEDDLEESGEDEEEEDDDKDEKEDTDIKEADQPFLNADLYPFPLNLFVQLASPFLHKRRIKDATPKKYKGDDTKDDIDNEDCEESEEEIGDEVEEDEAIEDSIDDDVNDDVAEVQDNISTGGEKGMKAKTKIQPKQKSKGSKGGKKRSNTKHKDKPWAKSDNKETNNKPAKKKKIIAEKQPEEVILQLFIRAIKTIHLPKECNEDCLRHTISVDKEMIKLCCTQKQKLFFLRFKIEGKKIKVDGKEEEEVIFKPGKWEVLDLEELGFQCPYLSQETSKGTVFVDSTMNGIFVRNEHGKWSDVTPKARPTNEGTPQANSSSFEIDVITKSKATCNVAYEAKSTSDVMSSINDVTVNQSGDASCHSTSDVNPEADSTSDVIPKEQPVNKSDVKSKVQPPIDVMIKDSNDTWKIQRKGKLQQPVAVAWWNANMYISTMLDDKITKYS